MAPSEKEIIITKILRKPFEILINLFDKNATKTFFSVDEFPWTKEIEKDWKKIRKELDNILKEKEKIIKFRKVSYVGDNPDWEPWRSYWMYCYGIKIKENCDKCPNTIETLKKIPGMKTAFFSIFEKNTHLPAHSGPYKGVLRYHLGLKIPKKKDLCKIRVKEDVRNWEEGKSLIFDDYHDHEAWNHSKEDRVVLFIDFERPLPFPINHINKLGISIAKRVVCKKMADTIKKDLERKNINSNTTIVKKTKN